MTVNELGDKLALKTLSGGEDRKVASCYVSDLLSRVLGGCKHGDAWVTVQSSLNVIAVAVMTEASCVILCEGVSAPEAVLEKAAEEGVTLFSSPDGAYALATRIAALGI